MHCVGMVRRFLGASRVCTGRALCRGRARTSVRETVLWVALLLLGLGTADAMAQQMSRSAGQIKVYASADSVYVGERFTLSIVATHSFSTTVEFPDADASDLVFGDIVAIERRGTEHWYLGAANPGMRVDSTSYTVTTFALDSARVPALPIRFMAGGDTVLAASTPMNIRVRSSVPPDAQGLRGLAPLAAFPRPRWPWVLLALAVVVLGALAYYYWRERQQAAAEQAAAPVPAPAVTPYEAARRRLNDLERTSDVNDAALARVFYIELSDIIRTYLNARLHIAALESTTAELHALLRKRPDVPARTTDRIHTVLELADLVKFADRRPEPDKNRMALKEVRAAIEDIERTRRPAAPVTASSNGAMASTPA